MKQTNLILNQFLLFKKPSIFIAFSLLILVNCSSCKERILISSDNYETGDILYGIVKKGIKERRGASRNTEPVGQLSYGNSVTFISRDTEAGIVKEKIHGKERISEYWLKVNDGGRICFIHGGGLSLENPSSFDSETYKPQSLANVPNDETNDNTPAVSDDCYLVVTEVNVRSDSNTDSKSLGKLQEGDFIYSNSSIRGEEVQDCDNKNDLWFRVNDGWINGLYLRKIDDDLLKRFEHYSKSKWERKYCYFAISKIKIRNGKNTGSTKMGEINKEEIIFSDLKGITGETVPCYSESNKWIRYSTGWVSKSYLIELRRTDLKNLMSEISHR